MAREPGWPHSRWAQGLRGLIILAVWLVGVGELSRYAASVRADEAAIAPELAAPPDPWAQASFPVENFTAYTSPFGYRQHPYGGYRFHYGLDIAAPLGSYVRSWWDGKVIEVSDNTACGTAAIIQSERWTHIYCHMQGSIVVEKDGDRVLVDRPGHIEIVQGQMVKAGTPIGRVGVTGRTTGPHLHWGMKYNGSWVDPALVLEAMLAAQSDQP